MRLRNAIPVAVLLALVMAVLLPSTGSGMKGGNEIYPDEHGRVAVFGEVTLTVLGTDPPGDPTKLQVDGKVEPKNRLLEEEGIFYLLSGEATKTTSAGRGSSASCRNCVGEPGR